MLSSLIFFMPLIAALFARQPKPQGLVKPQKKPSKPGWQLRAAAVHRPAVEIWPETGMPGAWQRARTARFQASLTLMIAGRDAIRGDHGG